MCQAEVQKLRGDVNGAHFDEFEMKYKLKRDTNLNGLRIGFVTVGGADKTIASLESAAKRLRKVGSTKIEWTLPKEKVWFSSHTRSGKVTAMFSGQGAQYINIFKDVALNWPQFHLKSQILMWQV